MSVSPLSGLRPKHVRTLVVHHCRTAGVQGKTLCQTGGFLLSRRGLDQVAGGSFELISRDTLNPQCPAYRSAASGLLDAFRSEVQVCPSTQLPLPYVRHQPARRPHQPQQFGFVGLLSAAKARADRPAHTSSLVSRAAVQVRTRSPVVTRAISRRHAVPRRDRFPRISHPKTARDLAYGVGK
jgi:hypothetical protein